MRFIRLDENNIVTGVRFGKYLVDGEIECELGELGQRLLEDGTFVDVPTEPIEPHPTLEDVAQTTLLETQYQTIMIEMLIGF